MRQLFESAPAACDEPLLFANMGRVELPLVERTFDDHGLKIQIDNELSERWITADVAFSRGMERLGIDLANDIAQVQIAIPDILDVTAANFTEIAFFATSHGRRL